MGWEERFRGLLGEQLRCFTQERLDATVSGLLGAVPGGCAAPNPCSCLATTLGIMRPRLGLPSLGEEPVSVLWNQFAFV